MDAFTSFRKIDTHVHIVPAAYTEGMNKHLGGNPDRYPVPPWSVELHLEFMDRLNIAGSAISVSSPHLNFSTPEYARDLARQLNEEAAGMAKKHPGKFAVMASLPLANVRDTLDEIDYCCDVLKVAGFTLPTNTRGMYITSTFLEPVWEALNRHGTIITIHPNKPTAVPAEVAGKLPMPILEFFFDSTRVVTDFMMNDYPDRYPNIKFLIPHCGAMMPYVVDRLEFATPVLEKIGSVKQGFNAKDTFKKFFFDVAGNSAAHQLNDALDLVSLDRFSYGTDFPFTPEKDIVFLGNGLINAPYLTNDQRKVIFYDNGKRLFPSLDA